jgi:hypothetical protein
MRGAESGDKVTQLFLSIIRQTRALLFATISLSGVAH